jgi:hypothetical protein
VGLSPDEENEFAWIARRLRRLGRPRIPWDVVAGGVAIAAIGVVGALLLGVSGHIVLFGALTFVVGLSVGLAVIGLADRRKHRG